jgi:signal transduction histidine kinase
MLATDKAALREKLRLIPHLNDLAEEGLQWLVDHGEEFRSEPGEIALKQGAPADQMVFLIEGELQAREEGVNDASTWVAVGPMLTGALPFSRMLTWGATGRFMRPSHGLYLMRQHFEEMLQAIPQMTQKIFFVLADRIRESARIEIHTDKLQSLGKLSAGLAHELNNPAAAAQRSTSDLRSSLQQLRNANFRLAECGATLDDRRFLEDVEGAAGRCEIQAAALSAMQRSDLEDTLTTWLEDHTIAEPWELASLLVEANVGVPLLDKIAVRMQGECLDPALRKVCAAVQVQCLLEEIEDSVGRISDLVKSIKEYTYMDKSPQVDVDVHKGLESTLTMLGHRLKKGVQVIRNYDRNAPHIQAHGSELNQVWTNIIDNAIDAMNGKGEIHIRTAHELGVVVVEIRDNGPGIPQAHLSRIFDPFFTTKDPGKGTGLGLDAVYRIITRHHGDINVTSLPGDTRFTIRLPLEQIQSKAG